MSQSLINHSPDLKKLQDEGYEVEIRSGHLLVKSIPYLDSNKKVKSGVLISTLTLAGDTTVKPDTHVVSFAGDYPCDSNGAAIEKIRHNSGRNQLASELYADHSFSAKPPDGYPDYYEKMVTYIGIISGPAESVDPSVTAKTFAVTEPSEGESVFNYLDTASSRAGISSLSQRLALQKIAIVGLGGTGSYILDLVAKTPVEEIHLFDGDYFLQHNAFRAPGAPSLNQLRERMLKVVYYQNEYGKMHRKIIAHPNFISADNLNLLDDMNFVFISCDSGVPKKIVVDFLEERAIQYVDVGMGLQIEEGSIGGILRVTTSSKQRSQKSNGYNRLSFSSGDDDAVYAKNIQIADLNALNAALAVMKWKKLYGFYRDLDNEHNSVFTIDGNSLINEDKS